MNANRESTLESNDSPVATKTSRSANAVHYHFPAADIRRHQRRYLTHLNVAVWQGRVQAVSVLRRIVDLTVVLLALTFLWPFMLLLALLIRLDSSGPAVFRQTRVGKHGTLFTCYKFRSMCVDAEVMKEDLLEQNEGTGPIFKMHGDPRVTRMGAFIRKFSLDELPQLFNILKGDMSLVGPRPPLPDEVQYYDVHSLRRLEVLPGLTGLPQISGRKNLDFEKWVDLDVEYISRQSLRQDIMIILKTIPAVIYGKGAY